MSYVETLITIQEEKYNNLLKNKEAAKEYIKNIYNHINIYEYDSYNKYLIDTSINEALSSIDMCEDEKEIERIKNDTVYFVNDIPTMMQQAEKNLPLKINDLLENVRKYYNSYNKTNYSEKNWNEIENIFKEINEYISNITVSTADITINNYIDKKIEIIDSILTIEEENKIILEEEKSRASKELNKYYKSLNKNNYENNEWVLITNRVNYVLDAINQLNNVHDIIKLVTDTINAIESMK